MGETQEERILQFLEENETPVVGIREGAWLLCENGAVTLQRRERRAESLGAIEAQLKQNPATTLRISSEDQMQTEPAMLLSCTDVERS